MANKRSILDQIMGSEEQDEPIIPQTEKEVIAKQAALEAEAVSPGSGEGWRRISTGETELPTPANLAKFKEEKPPMGMAESLKARSEIEDTSVPTYFPEDEGDESTSRQLAKQSATSLPSTAKDKLDVTKALEGTAKEKRSVMDAYQDALARRGGMQLVSDIGKASAQIGAGLAGGVGPGLSIAAPKMDTSIYDSISKRAEDSIKDFAIEKQLKDEEALKDPNSPYSKFMRDVLIKLKVDPKLVEGLPGHEMDKILGVLIKRDEAATKRIEARAKMAEALSSKEKAERERKERIYMRQVPQAIANTNEFIKGGTLGKTSEDLKRIDSAKAILHADDPKKLDEVLNGIMPQEQVEIARTLDRLLSGGAATKYGTEKLTPETARSWFANNLQKIVNEPVGAGAGDFLKRTLKTLDREAAIRRDIVNTNFEKSMEGTYSAYRNSEEQREVLDAYFKKYNTDAAAVYGLDREAQAPEGSRPGEVKKAVLPGGIIKYYRVDSSGKKMKKITSPVEIRALKI